jgi:very-short-patch-repair endonuclease
MQVSYLEQQFMRLLQRHELPNPVREYKFHPVRKWRFDFAWPKIKVAVEIDGGTFGGTKMLGNHAIGMRYQQDCIKSNAAQLEGWAVLRADREMVGTDEFGAVVRQMLLKRLESWNKQLSLNTKCS